MALALFRCVEVGVELPVVVADACHCLSHRLTGEGGGAKDGEEDEEEK